MQQSFAVSPAGLLSFTCWLQGLVPHPDWAAATPLPLPQLYMALVEGHTDLQLPLPNMHPDKAVMLSRLASMSLTDFATFTAPCQAYLAYTSPFVRNPHSEMGKRFAATAAEALCVRVALCETRPDEYLQTLGRHLLQSGPGTVQLPPDWTQMKVRTIDMSHTLCNYTRATRFSSSQVQHGRELLGK